MTQNRALIAAVVGVVLLAVAIPALAQNRTEAPERRRGGDDEFAARLAQELDLPSDRVEQAIQKVSSQLRAEWRQRRQAQLDERLDRAVGQGRLTREQANRLRRRLEDGDGVGPGRGWRWGHHLRGEADGDRPGGPPPRARGHGMKRGNPHHGD